MDAEEAARLEERFLGGINQAQDAYEKFVAAEAWTLRGYRSYIDWWTARVVPMMRALKMRPTKEIVSAGVAQVRKEEAELPPLQRRTQEEVAAMFGVDQATVSRSTAHANAYEGDLDEGAEKEEKSVPTPTQKRRPLPDTAKEAANRLRKEIERLERVYEDDRFAHNREQVATLTRSHLSYTVETAQRLLDHLNQGE